MRELTDHLTGGSGDSLTIRVADEPGAGGANHLYMIEGYNSGSNPSCPFTARYGKPSDHSTVLFQNGAIPERGINGVTQEAVLAIVIDRLRCFQAGPFANVYNAKALGHCEAALQSLKQRTLDRVARGVEGQHKA